MASWTAQEARAAFEIAPSVALDALSPPGTLLIVAPHPDDETLGCGGLIAQASAAGRRVVVALLTDGAASHPASPRFDAAQRRHLREQELRRALLELADEPVEIVAFGARDGHLAERGAQAAEWLEGLARQIAASAIVVTWNADPHPDHKAAFDAALAAARATGAALWAYPVWSLILPDDAQVGSPRPAVRLDIADQQDRKRRAIARHASQLDPAVMADPQGFLLRPIDVERHAGASELYLSILA